MLTDAQTRAASDLLFDHWRDGTVLTALPDALRPQTRTDGYAIQAHLEVRSTSRLYGWKIAATSADGQRHIGVDGPMAGRLLAERAHDDGAAVPFGANRMAVAEAEFAFRMARDLPPRSDPYEADEVLAAVASLHPAIELPDSRFADFATAGGPQLIADNACAHEFVLGPAAPDDWRAIDLAKHAVTGTVVGKLERDGIGANVLGDPRAALAWLANELSGLGLTLKAGQVVTTGTCLTPMPIAAGDAVAADFGLLGKVASRLGH